MGWVRHRTRVAALLLVLQAPFMAYGLTPLMATHCECTHGPETPCDCPHHGSANNLPPCHRHVQKTQAPASRPPGPCLGTHCGPSHPKLLLLTLVHLPARTASPASPDEPAAVPTTDPAPPETSDSPPRPPPRAWS